MKTNAIVSWIVSWIDDNGKYFSWLSIVCMIVCLLSCHMVAQEYSKLRMLEEEVERKTSTGALIETFGKSFFDGLTFGLFADEGLFTEYNKAKRWEDSVYSRAESSMQRLSFWTPIRNFSEVLLFVLIPLYVYYRKRRHDLSPVRDMRAR